MLALATPKFITSTGPDASLDAREASRRRTKVRSSSVAMAAVIESPRTAMRNPPAGPRGAHSGPRKPAELNRTSTSRPTSSTKTRPRKPGT